MTFNEWTLKVIGIAAIGANIGADFQWARAGVQPRFKSWGRRQKCRQREDAGVEGRAREQNFVW